MPRVCPFLLCSWLPSWQDLKAVNEEERNERIKETKTNLSAQDLCEDLPSEFATYMKYSRSLSFDEPPDYRYLRELFRDLFSRKEFSYDDVYDWSQEYDWTVKKYFEIHAISEPISPTPQEPSERKRTVRAQATKRRQS